MWDDPSGILARTRAVPLRKCNFAEELAAALKFDVYVDCSVCKVFAVRGLRIKMREIERWMDGERESLLQQDDARSSGEFSVNKVNNYNAEWHGPSHAIFAFTKLRRGK